MQSFDFSGSSFSLHVSSCLVHKHLIWSSELFMKMGIFERDKEMFHISTFIFRGHKAIGDVSCHGQWLRFSIHYSSQVWLKEINNKFPQVKSLSCLACKKEISFCLYIHIESIILPWYLANTIMSEVEKQSHITLFLPPFPSYSTLHFSQYFFSLGKLQLHRTVTIGISQAATCSKITRSSFRKKSDLSPKNWERG